MRLELIEGKLSRSVPRGLGGSNPTWLLDGRMGNHRLYPAADCFQRLRRPSVRAPSEAWRFLQGASPCEEPGARQPHAGLCAGGAG
jgi:hypothetical protein